MKRLKVLSAFDGISCGQIAINKAGFEIDSYYASEIDKNAIKITMKNYPNTIQLGDITKLKGEDLQGIDLLIGGSPCQGFSFAGKQLNFEDERSKLFFEYVRLLKEVKPKYFLLENVEMKKEYQDIITSYLGVEPIMINSNLVSASNRKRLYWTNILNITQPRDKGIKIKDIVFDNNYKVFEDDRIEKTKVMTKNYMKYDLSGKGYFSQQDRSYYLEGKFPTIPHCQPTNKCNIWLGENKHRRIHPIEAERAHNLPDNYTEGLSDSQRISCIGNGWTVDVIAHILKGIKIVEE